MGELLPEITGGKAGGDRKSKSSSRLELDDIGISKQQSHSARGGTTEAAYFAGFGDVFA